MLENYLREAILPRDQLSVEDIALANALAESYQKSTVTRKLADMKGLKKKREAERA